MVNQVYRPKIHGNSERFGICQLVPRRFASLSKHRFINPINPFLLARLLKPVENFPETKGPMIMSISNGVIQEFNKDQGRENADNKLR